MCRMSIILWDNFIIFYWYDVVDTFNKTCPGSIGPESRFKRKGISLSFW